MSTPTPEQTLLLRAALLSGDPARAAFAAWKPHGSGPIDRGTRRLLPLLHLNLAALGISYASNDRLVQTYAQAQQDNDQLLDAVAPVIKRWRVAGIDCIVLKGVPLALRYYPSLAARPMDDCDLLVRPEQALAAATLLMEDGWRAESILSESVLAANHALRFTGPAGHLLDLHWRLQPEIGDAVAETEQWQAAEAFAIRNVAARTLSAADLLLHVCVHGMKWSTTPPLRWAADAHMTITKAGDRLDWPRVVRRAERLHLVLPLRECLAFLRDQLDTPIPSFVLDTLQALHVPASAQLEHHTKLQPRNAARLLLLHWFWHRRLSGSGSVPIDMMRFPRYLQHRRALRPRA